MLVRFVPSSAFLAPTWLAAAASSGALAARPAASVAAASTASLPAVAAAAAQVLAQGLAAPASSLPSQQSQTMSFTRDDGISAPVWPLLTQKNPAAADSAAATPEHADVPGSSEPSAQSLRSLRRQSGEG